MSVRAAASTTTLNPATRAWLWGGSAILVSGLLRMLEALPLTAMVGSGPVTLMAATAFALGVVILALGVRRQGSLVARSGLGMTAMFVLAALDIVQAAIVELFPSISPHLRDAVTGLSDGVVLLQLAAAVVASLVIARAGAVRGALRWLPLVALACVVALQVLVRVVLQARGGLALSGPDVLVVTQVAMALLTSTLGLTLMLASPRAAQAARDE